MSTPRRTRRPLLAVAISTGLVASALVAGGSSATGSAPAVRPQKVLSHLLCYVGTFRERNPSDPNVVLEDQFGSTDATVTQPWYFCNPVRKTRRVGGVRGVTPIVDVDQHLTAYLVHSPSPPVTPDVSVTNQFGAGRPLKIADQPFGILVPARKAGHGFPVGLDHFLCYGVEEGKSIDRRVRLKDEFGTYRTTVLVPVFLCNPTVKSHPPKPPTQIQHPQVHLVCYDIADRDLVPPETRRTNTQFGRVRVAAKRAVLLCVPSTKELVP